MTRASPITRRFPKATVIPENVRAYFDHLDEAEDAGPIGLKEMAFGEYLVEQRVLDRFQLFRALQLQDVSPGVLLGECAAALGYVALSDIERLHRSFIALGTITL